MKINWNFQILLIVCFFISIIPGCIESSETSDLNTSISFIDARGEHHIIHDKVSRIVTQNSDLVEMIILLNAGKTVVGVSNSILEIPEIASQIPYAESIGDWQIPNIEKILSLHPDIMITYGGRTKNIDQILAANISAIALNFYHIPTLPQEARVLGKIIGKEEKAEEYASFIDNHLELIEKRLSSMHGLKSPKIYMEHYGEYSSEGKESSGTKLLNLLHASHIGEDLPGLTQKVSPEWIINQKPDIIIKIVSTKPISQELLENTRETIINRKGFGSIPAVKTGKVYVLNADFLNSPRGIVGAYFVAKIVYPELFDDINPDKILADYADQFYPGAYQEQAKWAPEP